MAADGTNEIVRDIQRDIAQLRCERLRGGSGQLRIAALGRDLLQSRADLVHAPFSMGRRIQLGCHLIHSSEGGFLIAVSSWGLFWE
jgi:hypothetical protein